MSDVTNGIARTVPSNSWNDSTNGSVASMAVGDIGIGDGTSRVYNRSRTYLLVALDVPFDGKGPTFW